MPRSFGDQSPGYIGGVGHGAVGFTTRSDIGPATLLADRPSAIEMCAGPTYGPANCPPARRPPAVQVQCNQSFDLAKRPSSQGYSYSAPLVLNSTDPERPRSDRSVGSTPLLPKREREEEQQRWRATRPKADAEERPSFGRGRTPAVKNKTPAPKQVSAEQLLRDAFHRRRFS